MSVAAEMLPSTAEAITSSFYLTRIVFLRALAFVYLVAFTVAWRQNKALIGDDGITPARYPLLEARQRATEQRVRREEWLGQLLGDERGRANRPWWINWKLQFQKQPWWQRLREVTWDRADRRGRPLISLFWLASIIQSKNNNNNDNYQRLNPWLDGVALAGMSLSALVLLLGAANVPLLFVLWICQRSFMAVGCCWYGFGWEPQLAELGFHALFLVPLLSLQPITSATPPSPIVLFAIRWFLFRIMLGAGLIKLKSHDQKWKPKGNLTAMKYFYETQPVPSVLTRFMHFLPLRWHQFEVLVNHFVELVAPWFLILPLPYPYLRAAGFVQIIFQLTLIGTGNLSFLNWLTMAPAICCLDDGVWRRFFGPTKVVEASIAAAAYTSSLRQQVTSLAFGALVAGLSIPVVRNLLAKRQQMNASFDPLRLINTYGAFGVVEEVREEWIISSADKNLMDWREYEFPVKPGDVTRRPRWITPYHYRLDWQLWIASSCRTLERSPWLPRFLIKLLQRDSAVAQSLLAKDPWEGDAAGPKYIRVDAYRYRFVRPGKTNGGDVGGDYWHREFVRRVYPRQGLASLESLQEEVQASQPHRPI